MSRVLLIGWDAADWKIIRPLIKAGQMPNLARLMAEGIHGNLATLYPPLSPILWTSIATGKRAYKHGIHGFSEPIPDGSGVRPITILSRKTKAVWNILNQNGYRSIVVGWWPSHPAEPINGVMVSNHFEIPVGEPGNMPPLSFGTIHPPGLAPALAELRVNPMELDGNFLRLFIPDYLKVDQDRDRRLHSLAKIIAETMSVHAVSTELLATQPWDFAALYYSGIDHFGHGFMRYHPPRLPQVSEADFAIYKDVIANAYRYHDGMLGALLTHTDANTTVVLLSDHGFHPDHLRPGYIPAEPSGPSVEHRHFGIVCMKGPGLRRNQQLFGASLLDICPTILTFFGLKPGKDMDGKVLVTAFERTPSIEPIESWDQVPGDSGTHRAEAGTDPVASAQAFKQLVDLGYVAPPPANSQEAVNEAVCELKYNLARAYRDGNCCGEAAALAEELWAKWPREHRFGILLVDCLGTLGEVERRRTAIEELGRRIERYRGEATMELAKRETNGREDKKQAVAPPTESEEARNQFELRHLRELSQGRPLLVEWLLVTQALLEKRPQEARRGIQSLKESGQSANGLQQLVAGALAQLGDLSDALLIFEQALESDPENAQLHSQLASLHFKIGHFDKAIASASESLSLLYFQPGIHALLGRALMENKRFAEAEKELQVAVAQSPRNFIAHQTLGKLYREHLDRPEEAFAHEGRARSLFNEQKAFMRESADTETQSEENHIANAFSHASFDWPRPVPFSGRIEPNQIITVVSGLPRSGTSMMMQLLVAGGREALTDSKRDADEDNPLGYFEFEKTLALANDNSWLPQARGKVVKIVAQLLPHLPRTEHYQVIFMERDLKEVIASQNVMLSRKNLQGSGMDELHLRQAYAAQLYRICSQLTRRPQLRTLVVRYESLLASPHAGIDQIAEFLGQPFDRQKALAAIRPDLRRQKV